MDEDKKCGSCESCEGCSDEFDSVITLTDEEGNDIEFEILDVIVMDEKEYAVVAEPESDEAVILEVKTENNEEYYDTVIDEVIADKVFKLYLEQE
ncbi:MAG: DUF1292 domain-containing protein [Clostridia bacterium]